MNMKRSYSGPWGTVFLERSSPDMPWTCAGVDFGSDPLDFPKGLETLRERSPQVTGPSGPTLAELLNRKRDWSPYNPVTWLPPAQYEFNLSVMTRELQKEATTGYWFKDATAKYVLSHGATLTTQPEALWRRVTASASAAREHWERADHPDQLLVDPDNELTPEAKAPVLLVLDRIWRDVLEEQLSALNFKKATS